MSAAVSESEVMLLIIPRERKLFAITSLALTRAQATRRELRMYTGALLVTREGTIRRVEEVRVERLFGETWLRRLVSRLTSAWLIATRLGPDMAEISLEELKQMISECISTNGGVEGPDADDEVPRARLIEEVNKSPNFYAMFEAMRMPPPEDALDVL